MTITIICDVLGAENNGTTIAAMNLIRSLKKKGHTLRVVCSDTDKKAEGYYILPKYSFGILDGYVAKNGVALTKPDTEILRSAIEGADVVHVMLPFAVSIAALKIARELNIPVTAGFHCQAENITNHIFMMNIGLANRLAYKIFYDKVYKYCACIHYPTQFICDVFEQQIRQKTPAYVISNGVGKEFVRKHAIRPDELNGKFIILFTGRYSKEKSHTVLIDGVKKSRYNDRIQLIFAGAGPQAEHIRAYAQERLVNPPIMQFYSREELIDVINYSDLYVHPAEIEIEAISCLEAIACGKVPVISDSPRSATRYFALTEKNTFKCADSTDLAQKIDYWIEHPAERQACSDQYLGYAQQFDFDICMDKMEQMLLDAANQ